MRIIGVDTERKATACSVLYRENNKFVHRRLMDRHRGILWIKLVDTVEQDDLEVNNFGTLT